MKATYISAFLHGCVALLVVVNAAWGKKSFSIPFIIVVAIVCIRTFVYSYAYLHSTNTIFAPNQPLNELCFCAEVVASMWHVLLTARIARSKRFVLCSVAGAAILTTILIQIGEDDSCSFFAPVGFVLVFVCFILLARMIRAGSNPYTLQTKRVPVELVMFHLLGILTLLASTMRSDACIKRETPTKQTATVLVLADVFVLIPIALTAWLRMDELSETEDYDNDTEDML